MTQSRFLGPALAALVLATALPALAEATAPCETPIVEAMTPPDLPARACDRQPGPGAEARSSKLPAAAVQAIRRAKQFKVVFRPSKEPSGEVLVLLHGSGGSEATLLPLAARVAPQADLVGIGGRVTQDGSRRWYQRITPTSFDQADIRAEVDAFAAFLQDQVRQKKLDLARATFLGYSNGANLLAATSLLHPGLIRRAALLRPMPVLETIPAADLSTARFLAVVGEGDVTYAPFAPALEKILRDHGARVDVRTVKLGHDLGDLDVKAVAEWMAAGSAVSMK